MIKNLPSMHKALSSVLSTAYTEHGGAHLFILALGKWRHKDQKFRVILGYTLSLRLPWAT